MASVNLEMDISRDTGTKPKIAADFLSLKLQLSSEFRGPEEEGYSPMTRLPRPLHTDVSQQRLSSQGEEDDTTNCDSLLSRGQLGKNENLVGNFEESGYMHCDTFHSSKDTV